MREVFVESKKFYYKHHSEERWLQLENVLNGLMILLQVVLMIHRRKLMTVPWLVLVALVLVLPVNHVSANQMIQV